MAEQAKTSLKIQVPHESCTTSVLLKGGNAVGIHILLRIIGTYRKHYYLDSDTKVTHSTVEVWFPYSDVVEAMQTSHTEVTRAVKRLKDTRVIHTCVYKKKGKTTTHFQLLDKTLIGEYGLDWLTGVPDEKKNSSEFSANLADYLCLDYHEAIKQKDGLATPTFNFMWMAYHYAKKFDENSRLIMTSNFWHYWNWFKARYEYDKKPKYNYSWLAPAMQFALKKHRENRESRNPPSILALLGQWHEGNSHEVPFHTFEEAYRGLTGEAFVAVSDYCIDEAV